MNKAQLAEKLASLEQQFTALEQSITEHNTAIQEANAEQYRLQGEYRLVKEQLDEPDKKEPTKNGK